MFDLHTEVEASTAQSEDHNTTEDLQVAKSKAISHSESSRERLGMSRS